MANDIDMVDESVTRSGPALTPAAPRHQLTTLVKNAAREAGFDRVGIAPVVVGLGAEPLARWLHKGCAGDMHYMAQRQAARADPNSILAGAKSVVVVALAYRTIEPAPSSPGTARISRYAWNRDYHDVIREKLRQVAHALRQAAPEVRSRAVVDSAPLMERDYARLAGLGWFGKNTLLLSPGLGSWFFLGALLVDCELEYDAPFPTDHCGTCTQCLESCPTQAFDGPYELDPRRCISYLTIEKTTPFSDADAERLGDWIFGCDICQDVCPWNQRVPPSGRPEFLPSAGRNPVDLVELLSLDDAGFRERFRDTPLWRTGRLRLQRNAAVVAGQQCLAAARGPLERLAASETDVGLVAAIRWALRRLDADGGPMPA